MLCRAGPRSGRAAASDPRDPFTWTSRSLLTRIGTVFQEPEHQLLAHTVRGELEVGPRELGIAESETVGIRPVWVALAAAPTRRWGRSARSWRSAEAEDCGGS